MKAMNKVEEMVLAAVREGKPVYGYMRDIWVDMTLRDMEERGETL